MVALWTWPTRARRLKKSDQEFFNNWFPTLFDL